MPRFGWTICIFFVLCAALRLARFNARIDNDDQPHKSAGFNTGVPSPAGAGMALLPLVVWLETQGQGDMQAIGDLARDYRIIGPWLLLSALLMISNVATYSWSSIRIRSSFRFLALAALGLIVAILIAAPWVGLILITIVYLGALPFSIVGYAKVKRTRKSSEAT